MYKISIYFVILLTVSAALLSGNSDKYTGEYILPLGPFRQADFKEFKSRLTGRFGDYRKSNVPGHKHSGIDIKAGFSEQVFAIGEGRVVDVFGKFPNKTVFIEHRDNRGKIFYSSYVHLENITVKPGDVVNSSTSLGRIFNIKELGASGFNTLPHLHFEIRKDISDSGEATYNCMTKEELNRYFIDPVTFFKSIFKEVRK